VWPRPSLYNVPAGPLLGRENGKGCPDCNLQTTPDGGTSPPRQWFHPSNSQSDDGSLKVPSKKCQAAGFAFDNLSNSWLGAVGITLAIGIAYFMAARFGLAFRAKPGGVAVFWPAAGIAIGALIALGPNARLPVAIGVIVATITSKLLITGNLWLGITFGVVCAGQTLLTAWLIERWFGRAFKLEDVPQVLGFLVASAAGAAMAAFGAVAAISFVHSTASPLDVWRPWFAACLLGTVTVAPLLIGLSEAARKLPPRRELIEGAVGLVTLAGLSVFLISLPKGHWSTALPVALVFPLLLWVAVRCRPVFAAAAAFVVAFAIIWSATFDMGHFGDASISLADRILSAQTLVLAAVLLALVLAALFADRRRTEQKLQKSERASRELLGALPAAIYVTDAVGRITYCNESAVGLWGLRPKLGEDRWCDLSRFYHANGAPMATEDCPTEIALKQGRIVRGREAIIERSDGTRAPIIPYPTPLRDGTGTIIGVVNMTVDISERKKAEIELAERNMQLELAGKAGLVGSYAHNFNTDMMQVSEGYAAIHGLPEGTTESSRSEWKRRTHPEDLARKLAIEKDAFRERRGEYGVEYRIFRGSEVRWIESRSFISYDSNGSPHRIIGVNIDITERKRAEEHQRILVAELDHRVKNMLATVSAVASRTQDASGSVEEFVTALDGRIRSMASAHELLSTRRWQGIPLAELVRRELAPYATRNNAEIEGPEVMLRAEAGQAVAMMIHELATNAAKYGAFSTRSGRVSVRWHWKLNGSAQIVLEWQESGGPRVEAPKRAGYGTSVVRELIPYEFDGTVDLSFDPEGFRCRFEIPFDRLSTDSRSGLGSEQPHNTERSFSTVLR
jgi:PAS domain S-box-containing protein